jgi:hypothetical protein
VEGERETEREVIFFDVTSLDGPACVGGRKGAKDGQTDGGSPGVCALECMTGLNDASPYSQTFSALLSVRWRS